VREEIVSAVRALSAELGGPDSQSGRPLPL